VCRECCITEHKQAVKYSVCAERYFRTRSTSQHIYRLLPIIVSDIGDLRLYIDQITLFL
jgi:hypothetical protein